jgi:hypothetical protein
MRGHGNVVVGPNVMRATIRAVYTEVNARLQTIALGLGGRSTASRPGRRAAREEPRRRGPRAWDGWKEKALRKQNDIVPGRGAARQRPVQLVLGRMSEMGQSRRFAHIVSAAALPQRPDYLRTTASSESGHQRRI